MGLDAMWQQCAYAAYQVWVWIEYEAGVHPAILLGAVIVIIAAFILYTTEVRNK